jgi:AcrR family transcriptional regulator
MATRTAAAPTQRDPEEVAADRARRRASRAGEGAAADRRARILAAAARRFAEHGFEATTVRQIADDVHILSGSLYHHFATKEDMLHEIVRDRVAFLGAESRRIVALPLDAEARLAMMIRTHLAELTAHGDVHAILYAERKFFRRAPAFVDVLEAKKDAFYAWQRVLEDGVASGVFAATTDIYLTISTVGRMLNEGADWFLHEDGSVRESYGAYTIERLADFYLAFILRALRSPERAALPVPD